MVQMLTATWSSNAVTGITDRCAACASETPPMALSMARQEEPHANPAGKP